MSEGSLPSRENDEGDLDDAEDEKDGISGEELQDRNRARRDQRFVDINADTVKINNFHNGDGDMITEKGDIIAKKDSTVGGNSTDTSKGGDNYGIFDLIKSLYDDHYPWGVILLILILILVVLVLVLLNLSSFLEILGSVLFL